MRSIKHWLLVTSFLMTGCWATLTPSLEPPSLAQEPPLAAPIPVEVAITVPELPEPVIPETVVALVEEEVSVDRTKAVEWIVSFMVKHAAPGRTTFYREALETKEEALERYNGIANAIVDVVYHPDQKPLLSGGNGRARSVTVILALMLFESGFMKNVDFGTGVGRGDAGNSWCLLQLNVGKGRTIKWNTKFDRLPRTGDDPADLFEGYTGPELVSDRRKCIGEAYKALRLSFGGCQSMNLPLDQKLRIYGSGSCNGAVKESRIRMKTAVKFWDTTHAVRGFKDSDLVAAISKELGIVPSVRPEDGPPPLPILVEPPQPSIPGIRDPEGSVAVVK